MVFTTFKIFFIYSVHFIVVFISTMCAWKLLSSWTDFMWFCRLPFWVNVYPQCEQWNFSPSWINFMCLWSFNFCVAVYLHCKHWWLLVVTMFKVLHCQKWPGKDGIVDSSNTKNEHLTLIIATILSLHYKSTIISLSRITE